MKTMTPPPSHSAETGSMDVAYVAHLARIHLGEEERRTLQAQLNQILEYVNQLNRLNVDGIEPTAHTILQVNVLRPDRVEPGLEHDRALANAPLVKQDQFAVPRILE